MRGDSSAKSASRVNGASEVKFTKKEKGLTWSAMDEFTSSVEYKTEKVIKTSYKSTIKKLKKYKYTLR
jgi:hypothetical protein